METCEVTCTCDDNWDSLCSAHVRENRLQDRVLELEAERDAMVFAAQRIIGALEAAPKHETVLECELERRALVFGSRQAAKAILAAGKEVRNNGDD